MSRDQLADWLHCLQGGMYDWVQEEIEKELAKPEQEFYPDWNMIQPYHERIAELEAQLAQLEQESINKMPTKIFGPNLEKILNAAGFYRQPEQKPVAWLYNGHLHECDPSDWAESEVKPLYAAPPPKREWVGLTQEEVQEIAKQLRDDAAYCSTHFAIAIEAELRRKNNAV